MAIIKYAEKTTKIPIGFMCDICKRKYELDSEDLTDYDIKTKCSIENQMAVIKYSYPVGAYQERTENAEKHCCCTSCLIGALLHVPFSAEITIPSWGVFDRKK